MQVSSEIENLIREWFECFERGDASWLDRSASMDPSLRLIGYEPDEWLQGEAALENARSDVARLAGTFKITVDECEAFSEGTAGWGAATVSILLGGVMDVKQRWSFVFHQEDGQWKSVQSHISFGITRDQLIGLHAS